MNFRRSAICGLRFASRKAAVCVSAICVPRLNPAAYLLERIAKLKYVPLARIFGIDTLGGLGLSIGLELRPESCNYDSQFESLEDHRASRPSPA